jgi:hypothetical protein
MTHTPDVSTSCPLVAHFVSTHFPIPHSESGHGHSHRGRHTARSAAVGGSRVAIRSARRHKTQGCKKRRVAMTVVLDWASAEWPVPEPPQVCSLCGDSLSPPFMHWYCWGRAAGEDKSAAVDVLVCAQCCHWHRRGFAADMARVDAVKEALDAGPDYPTLCVTQ